ncbi:MotA/TolQ/ExbB proton channel family protein [Blastopirellula sp. JC732]|uniref:MotA/TolQ/ExbB proton channel family protein n=1 Tax=Blastopirellula sediminis TaxID=2894196 RepID=A0A9X1SHB3_9BACT|nr:MotA/TolQ/ExbB proton channel family protein [Blastopirellula sediminis]MCC9605700.1 MotA/TolQ/ExbB proton channel family protein [Blastopirellula sediminis]MCC9631000.1 MotA/TolQ/ExbB proton channel family protein [Blastopirellula sediminis]
MTRFSLTQRYVALLLFTFLLTAGVGVVAAWAQENDAAATEEEPAPTANESGALLEEKLGDDNQLHLVALILKGGQMMIPIGLMSVLVVTLAFERAIALRRGRIIPPNLVEGLEELQDSPQGFQPKEAYRLCKKYPSAMASIVESMLSRIGRPQAEVVHAVNEASEREADRLYGNVRWLTLAAGVTPLMGLLGTVWGIIWAFYKTTQLDIGGNRANQLAEGIYVALVTTLGGLVVAIPAAILAQYFESRIINLFHQIDERLFSLLPAIEEFEGKTRIHQHHLDEEAEESTPEQIAS